MMHHTKSIAEQSTCNITYRVPKKVMQIHTKAEAAKDCRMAHGFGAIATIYAKLVIKTKYNMYDRWQIHQTCSGGLARESRAHAISR